MSDKNWSELTQSVQSVLEASLTKTQVSKVMDKLNGEKGKLLKLFKAPIVRAEKRKKDPNAPKKNMTNYLFFCNERRSTITASNPTMKAPEVTKKLAELWKSLKENDKKKYNKLAEDDKGRYEREMKDYTPPPQPVEDTTEKKKGKRKSDKPRRISGYDLFGAEVRANLKQEKSTIDPKAIFGEISERWRKLSEEQQEVYREQASQQNEASGLGARSTTGTGTRSATSTQSKPVVSRPEPSVPAPAKGKTTGKGVKRLETLGFQRFSAEKFVELQDSHPTWKDAKLNSEVLKEWNALSPEDRETLEEEATADV